MSGGGGKGGSQETTTQVPPWIQQPAQRAIARGEDIAKIGYTPYMGPDVAALTPLQMGAMQNTNSAAQAFGLGGGVDPMAGMPQAQNFGGAMGYSSYPIYQQTMDQFAQERPGQFDYMNNFFIDPVAGGLAPQAPAPVEDPMTTGKYLSTNPNDPDYFGNRSR